MQRSLAHRLSSSHLPALLSGANPTTAGSRPTPTRRSVLLLAPRTPQECFVGDIGTYNNNKNGHCGRRNYATRANRVDARKTRNNNSNTRTDAIVLNKKIIGFGKQGQWKEILQLFEKEKDLFNNVNYATAFSQLGRIRNIDRTDNPLLESFVNEYATRLESGGLPWAGNRGLVNVVHALGKIQHHSPGTESVLSFVAKKDIAQKIVRECNAQEVANVAWSFAKLGVSSSHHEELFAEIESRADWLVTGGTAQTVANTAWALAKLGYAGNAGADSEFFAAINAHADWLVSEGQPQAVANLAWACAKLNVSLPKKLLREIDNHADDLVANGNPQAVANIAWSFAKLLGGTSPSPDLKFFDAIDNRAGWLATEGAPQAVANVAWACATLDAKAPRFFEEIETNRAEWLVTEGTPQAVANVAWAFATLDDAKAPQLFEEIENRAEWLVTEGTPQAVANVAWAFATLDDAKAPQLFEEIENCAKWLVTEGTPQAVATAIWAASRLQHRVPNLMKETAERGAWLVEEGSPETISNAAVAFADCGYHAGETFFEAIATDSDVVSKLINDDGGGEPPRHAIGVCYAMAVLDYLGTENSIDAFSRLWNTAIDLDPELLVDDDLKQLSRVLAVCKAKGITTELQQPPTLLAQKIGW